MRSPSACSGDMWAGVPSIAPVRVSGAAGVGVASPETSDREASDREPPDPEAGLSFASPKSRTLTRPSPVTTTLPGLRSR